MNTCSSPANQVSQNMTFDNYFRAFLFVNVVIFLYNFRLGDFGAILEHTSRKFSLGTFLRVENIILCYVVFW